MFFKTHTKMDSISNQSWSVCMSTVYYVTYKTIRKRKL